MELPISFDEYKKRKDLHGFIEVYITSSSIEAIENLFGVIERKKGNKNGALIISRSAIEILGAELQKVSTTVRNLNRSGLIKSIEETASKPCDFAIYLASTKPDLTRENVRKALNVLFKSSHIPEKCFEEENSPPSEDIKLAKDEPNKFRFVIRNYDFYKNP